MQWRQGFVNAGYKSNYKKEEPSRKRCFCGFHIRGKNHEEGSHHKKGK